MEEDKSIEGQAEELANKSSEQLRDEIDKMKLQGELEKQKAELEKQRTEVQKQRKIKEEESKRPNPIMSILSGLGKGLLAAGQNVSANKKIMAEKERNNKASGSKADENKSKSYEDKSFLKGGV